MPDGEKSTTRSLREPFAGESAQKSRTAPVADGTRFGGGGTPGTTGSRGASNWTSTRRASPGMTVMVRPSVRDLFAKVMRCSPGGTSMPMRGVIPSGRPSSMTAALGVDVSWSRALAAAGFRGAAGCSSA